MPDEQIPAELYDGQRCHECGNGIELVDVWRKENILASEDLLMQCRCPYCGAMNSVLAKPLPPSAS
jgi:hypothetical protein